MSFEFLDQVEFPQKWLLTAKKVINNKRDLKLWEELLLQTERLPTKDGKNPVTISESSPDIYKRVLYAVYENLLEQFPFCEQYWCDYATQRFQLGEDSLIVKDIFKKGLQCLKKSIILWECYLKFVMKTSCSSENILNAFEQARINVGHHYYAHVIYDMYLDYLRRTNNRKLYHRLLRRIIEIPMYQYSKYFNEYLRLLQNADLETIKYFVSTNELNTVFNLTWEKLLPTGDKVKRQQEPELTNLKKKLKKIFTDIFIVTQYHSYQMWDYERDLKQPYYYPGKELTVKELNTWNRYLDYLELYTLKDISKDKRSGVTKFHKALLETAYERCLICAADYPFFWIKYANLKLNVAKIDEAKHILIRGLCSTDDLDLRLRMRLIDIEILSGNKKNARDLVIEGLTTNQNSLGLTLKFIQLEHMRDSQSTLKIVKMKLEDAKGTSFETQFDFLFREILSYADIDKREIAALFKQYEAEKKNSYHYIRGLLDFYKCYKQDRENYKHALELATKCENINVRKQLARIASDDTDNEFF